MVEYPESAIRTSKFRKDDWLTGISARISEQLEKVRDGLKVIHAKDEAADAATGDTQTAVEETQEIVRTSFSDWAEQLRNYCETTYKATEITSIATVTTVC
ncbi:hypothetical protein EUX98_g1708 [Antrodiella citrinella]|uniref:Uncharacterized protein n=1 Tax=Antrodiella citrinella TaxID=2447956 RepID=A0A4S4N0S2_9APHY|nr:hypothetical protein EUX98_g1708 [Antrodiella citrinella]